MARIPALWAAEAGWSRVPAQPETLSSKNKTGEDGSDEDGAMGG